MTQDIYEAVRHGYLPAPERLRGEHGRWLWRYPPEFDRMLAAYRYARSRGSRGDELHFAMWWLCDLWHEGVRRYVGHITANFARAVRLLAGRQKQVGREDVQATLWMLSLLRASGGALFHPNPDESALQDALNDLLDALASAKPADEDSKRLWANWLFDNSYRQQAATSDTFNQVHRLPELLGRAATSAEREEYERAREDVAPIVRQAPLWNALCAGFATWLQTVRSTEGRYLRPLKRAPGLALTALMLATRLSVIKESKPPQEQS